MAEYSFILENFTENIDEFDRTVRKMIRNVKSWSYSYDTQTLIIEIEEAGERKVDELKKIVRQCL